MRFPLSMLMAATLGAVLAGCAVAPPPNGSAPAPAPAAAAPAYVSGAPDTTDSVPGSANALYVFRFKQTDPASSQFNYRDRYLSFYFRPSPTALYFRVENLQGRPVQLDWEHSIFYDVNGRSGRIAHGPTRWKDRTAPLVYTLISGGQQFGDYMFPMDYLVDPGAAADPNSQPHLPLVAEDASAPTFSGQTFGVDFAFVIEDRPRVYPFRFQIASVIPR